MNIEASNKLLKQIEEPAPKTIFIFITNAAHLLLPTVQSRLQTKYFNFKIQTTI